ncbi:hypothetical protein Tco_0374015 [Tanacetum coccineum]
MLNRHKNWLVHKQTACGKDFSNPFMVDNLPKIVGFSTHLASLVKSWLVQDQTVLALASPKANELTIPEQTATGKGTSNPFMAGSLPKTTKPTSQDEIPPPPPPPPSSPQTPTQETPHTVSTIKLPILKKGQYDIWAMKMEHYLAHTDYPIWEVIQNGNGPVSITTDTQGQIKVLPPRTAEEIVARERERKGRTTLLMALPEDHLAKFHKMTDAKEMWDAIKSRFGGNDESKKICKNLDLMKYLCNSTPIETQKPLVKDEEASDVDVHLYRSMIGSLMYLTASRPDIMFVVCACSRVSSFDLESYSDSDYAGANLDRKSTTGGCQFLGRRLISWQCKKQTIVATSTTEAEYVAAASCCGQVLWIQNQMLDYGFNFMNTKIYIDNESTICIVKNPVYHSKTKHIAIRHHFIRDAYEKKLIQVLKIHTDDNVADLLTKAFDVSRGLIEFRESLRRVTDGTEALLIPTLFILWLDKVSTDSAKLVPLGKVCTAIETLKKNTAKALISLLTTITLSTTMAVLDSCPKHNMVAYLEKSEGNAEFHEIIDFLKRSSIHHALTVSPVVSTTFVEQFWTSAKSKIINNVRHITAKVAGKSVSISEASIRSDLLFDDADGIDSLPNQAIFDAIQLMGYEGDLTVLTFNKALFSPQWRFLFHTMNHCLSSKSTSWDQIPTIIATAVICLTSNQKYNFSKLIFDGMLRHLDAKKKFVMYPRFISILLDKQLANVPVPLDHFLVNTLTSKVFSFMVKKGKHFSGKVTPLFASMLVQPTEDEGAPLERPSKAQPTPSPAPTSKVPIKPQTGSSPAHTSEVPIEQQTDPSPRPSPFTIFPNSIPETSSGNLGGHSSSDKSLSRNEGDMTLQSVYDLCLSLCAQVSDQAKKIQHLKAQIKNLKKQTKPGKFAKGEPSVYRDPLFDDIPEDTLDHMETENAQVMGRTRDIVGDEKEIDENILSTEDVLSTDKEKVSTDRPIVSTDGSKVSTDRQIEGTDEQIESTDEQRKDDETIAKGYILVTEEGLVPFIKIMLVEKKYPLRKKVLLKMLELKLESEEDSTMALELIRFVKKLLAELEPEDSDGDEEDL